LKRIARLSIFRDNRTVRVTSRVRALLCLAAGVVVARPAAASMTMVFRDEKGVKRTYHQEGTHVRIVNPDGEDEGAAAIIDVATNQFVIVYDDAKAYYDFNKAIAAARPFVERAIKQAPRARRQPAIGYRPLGENRRVNGFTCAMYERVVGSRVEEQICFATWGEAIGQEEDFAWFDKVIERMVLNLAGKQGRAIAARWKHEEQYEQKPGLAIWSLSTRDKSKGELVEIVKLSRDPLPLAMFKVPADYKEISQPLSASEHHPAPPPVADVPTSQASGRKITGAVAIILMIGMGIGLLFHSLILHVAANVVLQDPHFMQAVVAAGIVWLMLVVIELIGLPWIIGLGLSALATFAGLKISYGASVPRTLALFFVSGAIALVAAFGANAILH